MSPANLRRPSQSTVPIPSIYYGRDGARTEGYACPYCNFFADLTNITRCIDWHQNNE